MLVQPVIIMTDHLSFARKPSANIYPVHKLKHFQIKLHCSAACGRHCLSTSWEGIACPLVGKALPVPAATTSMLSQVQLRITLYHPQTLAYCICTYSHALERMREQQAALLWANHGPCKNKEDCIRFVYKKPQDGHPMCQLHSIWYTYAVDPQACKVHQMNVKCFQTRMHVWV